MTEHAAFALASPRAASSINAQTSPPLRRPQTRPWPSMAHDEPAAAHNEPTVPVLTWTIGVAATAIAFNAVSE
jgi:hypothetical protein